MRIHPADQSSAAWMLARLGVPTASQFHRIITPARLDYSSAADGYINELVAERILGEPLEEVSTAAMERGSDLEDDARDWYSMIYDVEVREVGLCLRDDMDVGASPDGLVGDDGGVEIKCPGLANHIGNLRAGEVLTAKPTQVHGALWVTGREWWDVISYHPGAPEQVVQRVLRDEKWMTAFDEHMATFMAQYAEALTAIMGDRVNEDDPLTRSLAGYAMIYDGRAA